MPVSRELSRVEWAACTLHTGVRACMYGARCSLRNTSRVLWTDSCIYCMHECSHAGYMFLSESGWQAGHFLLVMHLLSPAHCVMLCVSLSDRLAMSVFRVDAVLPPLLYAHLLTDAFCLRCLHILAGCTRASSTSVLSLLFPLPVALYIPSYSGLLFMFLVFFSHAPHHISPLRPPYLISP